MSYDKAYYDLRKADKTWMTRRNDRQRESYFRNHRRRLDDMARQRLRRKSPENIDLWARKHMLSDARARASRRGLAFNLSVADICIPKRCPVLGIEISFRLGKPGPNSPSLDRFDNNLGYTRENVWVISRRANTIKSDATLAELEAIVHALKKHDGQSA